MKTEATLDNWTTIFLIIAMQGVLLFFLFLFNKHWRETKNKVLASIILSFSLMLLYYVAFWTRFLNQLHFTVHLLGELTYIIAPLTFIYISQINNKLPIRKFWPHFIPFGIVSIAFLANVYRFGFVFQNLYLIIYTYFIWKSLDKKSSLYKWTRQVAISFSMFSAGLLLYYTLVWNRWLTPQYDYWISASMSFFIYFIGYKAILKPELLTETKPKIKYEKSLISDTAAISISNKIIQHIEANKIYKKAEFKLSDLADELSIPSHTISQVLNLKLNQSFNEIINSYRIKEAKKLLQEQENESIISIAYSVGFNNKVSFNNSFKKYTGYTPSEYRSIENEIKVSLN